MRRSSLSTTLAVLLKQDRPPLTTKIVLVGNKLELCIKKTVLVERDRLLLINKTVLVGHKLELCIKKLVLVERDRLLLIKKLVLIGHKLELCIKKLVLVERDRPSHRRIPNQIRRSLIFSTPENSVILLKLQVTFVRPYGHLSNSKVT